MSGLLKYANRAIISFTRIEKSTAFLHSFPGICKSFANIEAQHTIYWDFLKEFNHCRVLGFFLQMPYRHQTSDQHFGLLRSRRRAWNNASSRPPQTAALPLGGTHTSPKIHIEASNQTPTLHLAAFLRVFTIGRGEKNKKGRSTAPAGREAASSKAARQGCRWEMGHRVCHPQ